jgi:3-oxoacyl-[acyl-carrier protein] reductase
VQFHGTAVAVAGSVPLAARLAAGLNELGAAARAVSLGRGWTREDGRGALGAIDALVYAVALDLLEDRLLADTDEEQWAERAEEPIWAALVALQAGYAALGGRGGPIVVVVPSIALTGAAGLAPAASAAEGIRQLVKSAARAWGRDGVRVNCVTAPLEDWSFAPDEAHRVPNRYGPSLEGANTPADLAGAVAILLDGAASAVTGTTVGADRGTVLAP